ncbi:MAG: DUF6089 family protein [Ferruginibacter sp.]
MNYTIQAIVFIAFLFITSIPGTQAQVSLNKWQVGVNGGIFVYQGDLNPSDLGSYKTIKPAIGVYVSRILNPSFLLRTNLAVGRLYGNDASYSSPAWRQQRNYNFTTPLVEISELLVWNMFSNNSNELKQRFSPYVFGGLGLSFLRINRDFSKFNDHYFARSTNILNGLRADNNHTPPGAALVIPMGLGTEFYLTSKLSLTAETNFRYTFTDYLDGFSLGANPDKKDFYHSHTIGLLFRFGKSNPLDCPVLKQ